MVLMLLDGGMAFLTGLLFIKGHRLGLSIFALN